MARTKSAELTPPPGNDGTTAADASAYTVVARRYRPQRFEDVVGQDHVVQALRNAIRLNRVTHAYLFSGTRGVGKTSMARIFAKCLNCVRGPTDRPCLECDICQDIAAGQDVDVIEIDGASNNGVEQVRELRQNAGLRPSRAQFKIYYIDEVHMLSTGAFNALLKTLEEPPEHVKFFFATTEPNKIPITVLSRCQRFDFAGIAPDQILQSLARICEGEGIEADQDALQAVARRAGGSMRDAQSLLEQLLSFGGKRLTSELVHQALGLAPDDRILDLIDALADHDAARALTLLDGAIRAGVQPVEMLMGVLEFLRDVMVVAVGAEVDTLSAPPSQRERLRAVAGRWPIDSVIAALQILAEARARLRGSAHGRILIEMALCRVARLEDLAELSTLIGELTGIEDGSPPPSPGAKKKSVAPAPEPPAPHSPPAASLRSSPRPAEAPTPAAPEPAPAAPEPTAVPELRLEDATAAWTAMISKVGVALGTRLSQVKPTSIEPPAVLVVALAPRYNEIADLCERPEARSKIEEALGALLRRPVTVRFERGQPNGQEPEPPARPTAQQQIDEVAADPLVQQLTELFEARRVRIDRDEAPDPAEPPA